jgi:hypothetical protein
MEATDVLADLRAHSISISTPKHLRDGHCCYASSFQHPSGSVARLDRPLVAVATAQLWRQSVCGRERCGRNAKRGGAYRACAVGVRMHHVGAVQPVCCVGVG